jgi:hypothetical protein
LASNCRKNDDRQYPRAGEDTAGPLGKVTMVPQKIEWVIELLAGRCFQESPGQSQFQALTYVEPTGRL